jgi:hypothetical protein
VLQALPCKLQIVCTTRSAGQQDAKVSIVPILKFGDSAKFESFLQPACAQQGQETILPKKIFAFTVQDNNLRPNLQEAQNFFAQRGIKIAEAALHLLEHQRI